MIAMTPTTSRFYGWTLVGAAFVVAAFGWGVGFYGPPVWLKALHDSRGWSVGLISAAITTHFLCGALAVANLPKLYNRFGIAPVTAMGSVSLALGAIGWSVATAPWQLFAATLFTGAGWVALGPAGVNAMVAPWFNRRRPAAISMAYNGASVGGVLFTPLWVALIGWGGFRCATVIFGIATIAVLALLSARVLHRTPQTMGQLPDGDEVYHGIGTNTPAAAAMARAPVARLWRDRAFLTLALGTALGLFAQIGLIAHLFSLLVPALGASAAGFAASFAAAMAVLGRSLTGWFLPSHADRRVVGALNYGVQVLGCCAFLAAGGTNIQLLLAVIVFFGIGIGNATSMPPLIAQSEFARADVVRVVALVTAVSQASYAFAPAVFGLIRDFTTTSGGTAVPLLFVTAATFQAAAAWVYFSGRDLCRRRAPEAIARAG